MSIELTGSTSAWDDYRKQVITVHNWLFKQIEPHAAFTETVDLIIGGGV